MDIVFLKSGEVINVAVFPEGGEPTPAMMQMLGADGWVIVPENIHAGIGDTYRDGTFYDAESNPIIEDDPARVAALRAQDVAMAAQAESSL